MSKDKEQERRRLKDLHDMYQSTSFVVDNLPRLWYGLYRQCVKQGFNESQAMELVKVYINTTLGVARYLRESYDNDFE
ncbi:MAG: hypothetical protein FWH27_16445 [Planctomycetaceae bacterium]|nr:hypothetical protein [Planctomycetaceae bacterium]